MSRKTMETRSLYVALTDEQVESRSRQLSQEILNLADDEAKLDDFEADMKASVKAQRKGIAFQRGDVNAQARAVAERRVKMPVDCDWKYVLGDTEKGGVKILVRRDTGEAIECRPLTQEERQLVIGEALEEASAEQLSLWEGQLAAAGTATEVPEEGVKLDADPEEED